MPGELSFEFEVAAEAIRKGSPKPTAMKVGGPIV
jgi:hypothetical protein